MIMGLGEISGGQNSVGKVRPSEMRKTYKTEKNGEGFVQDDSPCGNINGQ
jgi:hypothetical protein